MGAGQHHSQIGPQVSCFARVGRHHHPGVLAKALRPREQVGDRSQPALGHVLALLSFCGSPQLELQVFLTQLGHVHKISSENPGHNPAWHDWQRLAQLEFPGCFALGLSSWLASTAHLGVVHASWRHHAVVHTDGREVQLLHPALVLHTQTQTYSGDKQTSLPLSGPQVHTVVLRVPAKPGPPHAHTLHSTQGPSHTDLAPTHGALLLPEHLNQDAAHTRVVPGSRRRKKKKKKKQKEKKTDGENKMGGSRWGKEQLRTTTNQNQQQQKKNNTKNTKTKTKKKTGVKKKE